MNKIKEMKIFFLIAFIPLFLTSCGLEDILFFEPPTLFRYVAESDESVYIEFTGFNQEQEDTGKYCFVGYDVYYYFDSESNKARAQIYLPNLCLTADETTDVTVTDKNRINEMLLTWDNFYDGRENFYGNITETYRKQLYRYVTLPVTLGMIRNVLYDGNSSNVRAYFGDMGNTSGERHSNPQIIGSNEFIRFINLFPNIDHYPDDYDYEEYERNGKQFKGFRDARFYKKMGINPVSGTANEYKCYFYAVAKGFDSATKTSFTSFSESSKSSTIQITFTVDSATME